MDWVELLAWLENHEWHHSRRGEPAAVWYGVVARMAKEQEDDIQAEQQRQAEDAGSTT